MEHRYLRMQGREDSCITQYPKGAFSLCWNLIRHRLMTPEGEQLFTGIDDWFKENLPEPPPCVNRERVITFFKAQTTGEMHTRFAPALALLDKYCRPYDVVYTHFAGTIVYEDERLVAVRVVNGRMG